jgi:hypothetical protein
MLRRFETTTILKILQDGFAFLVVSEKCNRMSDLYMVERSIPLQRDIYDKKKSGDLLSLTHSSAPE